MKVRDFVVQHPKVSTSDLAVKARAIMRQWKLRALPVFDKNNKLAGIITRSDLVKITSTKSNITVGGLIWRPLIKANAESDILAAGKIMIGNNIKQLAVFDNSKFLGIVRDVDVLKAIISLKLKPKKKKVSDITTKSVKSFLIDDPISRVWSSTKDHSGFPVLDKGRVVGIISTQELLDSKRARIERESKSPKKPAKVGHVMRIIIGAEKRFLLSYDANIEEAIKKMLNEGLNILPVVEQNNRLVGIVTRKDLIKAYV